MSIQERARALMVRHHHLVKNRRYGFLIHTATEVNLSMGTVEYWEQIQEKPLSSFCSTYAKDLGLGLDNWT